MIYTGTFILESNYADYSINNKYFQLLRDTDFTDDNASYTVTSKCRRFRTKIRVSKATSPECVLFSSRYIYQFVCLSLYMCVSLLLSIILVLRFLSIQSKGRTKRKNRQTVIPNTVYPLLRERVE